jgi:hypothetical protein
MRLYCTIFQILISSADPKEIISHSGIPTRAVDSGKLSHPKELTAENTKVVSVQKKIMMKKMTENKFK